MKRTIQKIFANITVLSLVFVVGLATFAGCGAKSEGKVDIRVGGLKGPTSMGLLFLQEMNESGNAGENYEFIMVTGADELLTMMVKDELDIALIPANVASVLYNKTEGGVSVIDINTLGVLYMVSGDDSIKEPTDLKGKTVYLTGKGTTPDYDEYQKKQTVHLLKAYLGN